MKLTKRNAHRILDRLARKLKAFQYEERCGDFDVEIVGRIPTAQRTPRSK